MSQNGTVTIPKVGDEIYVPTSLYLGHGRDDVEGGLAKITSVKPGISAGKTVSFVTVAEHPGVSYNLEFLAPQQEKLKEEFGNNRAHPDPDYREEFNEP